MGKYQAGKKIGNKLYVRNGATWLALKFVVECETRFKIDGYFTKG